MQFCERTDCDRHCLRVVVAKPLGGNGHGIGAGWYQRNFEVSARVRDHVEVSTCSIVVQGDCCIGYNSAGGIDDRTRDGALSRALCTCNNRGQAETQQAHREHREALTDQLNKHEEALLRIRRAELTQMNLCAGARLRWRMCKLSAGIPVSRLPGSEPSRRHLRQLNMPIATQGYRAEIEGIRLNALHVCGLNA